jgi:hypothetical protein
VPAIIVTMRAKKSGTVRTIAPMRVAQTVEYQTTTDR